MRAAGVALQAFLASKQPFFQADLFTFSLSNGAVYRWTTTDAPIVAGGSTWVAVGPVLSRTGWAVKNTMEVPQMTLKLMSNGQDFGGLNIKLAIHNGLLDRAVVRLDRAIMPTFGDVSLGFVGIFQSTVSSVSVTALGADITIKGRNTLLQMYLPRNTYQLGCTHSLYDSGCTLVRSTHQETHVVAASPPPNASNIAFVDSPIVPSSFLNGTIQFLTGVCVGQHRTLQNASASVVQTSYPLYGPPAPGDQFVLTQGCVRTEDRCNQLGNKQNFRGFPFIPPVQVAL